MRIRGDHDPAGTLHLDSGGRRSGQERLQPLHDGRLLRFLGVEHPRELRLERLQEALLELCVELGRVADQLAALGSGHRPAEGVGSAELLGLVADAAERDQRAARAFLDHPLEVGAEHKRLGRAERIGDVEKDRQRAGGAARRTERRLVHRIGPHLPEGEPRRGPRAAEQHEDAEHRSPGRQAFRVGAAAAIAVPPPRRGGHQPVPPRSVTRPRFRRAPARRPLPAARRRAATSSRHPRRSQPRARRSSDRPRSNSL